MLTQIKELLKSFVNRLAQSWSVPILFWDVLLALCNEILEVPAYQKRKLQNARETMEGPEESNGAPAAAGTYR